MECQFSAVRYRTCHRMHSRHVPFPACRFAHYMSLRPPRRLSPRFPRRFSLSDYPSPLLSVVRVDFITSVPARAAFSKCTSHRSCDVVPVRPPHSVLVRRLHMLIYIAFGRRIVASSRDAPSPHRRPCLIAARIWRRLDLLVAWLREGRGEEHDMTNR